jgi:hypothetical protein
MALFIGFPALLMADGLIEVVGDMHRATRHLDSAP